MYYSLVQSYSVQFGSTQSTLVLFGPARSIMSTLVLFSPIWLYSVHQFYLVHSVYFDFIQSTSVLFGPFWSYSVQFGHNRSKLVIFGPFCPLWSFLFTLVLFSPLSLIRATMVQFGPIQAIRSIWSYSIQFDCIRSTLVLFAPLCSIWSFGTRTFFFFFYLLNYLDSQKSGNKT